MKLPPPPRLSGSVLRGIVRATDRDSLRRVVGGLMRKDLGLDAALALPASAREAMPLSARPWQARGAHPRGDASLPLPAIERSFTPTAAAVTARYADGSTDPVQVTERAFRLARNLAAMKPSMGPLLYFDEERALRDAAESRERWKAGKTRGPLDGVPVPVKEEVDLEGQGARLGTAIPARTDAKDATVVKRLRAAGAIVLGHTSMTEYGMSPLGVNTRRSLPRNAQNPKHAAGGSSTGSAVAVTTGLAPVALGSDGGGSVRIPASFNGIYGIKPTFGRISRFGDGFGGTMAHIGPLGASVRDLAIFLEAVSGEDAEDELTHRNPGFTRGWLESSLANGVAGMRIGVMESEIDAADPQVARACRQALDALQREGATLVPVSLSMAKHAPAIGYLSIGLEAYVALLAQRRDAWDTLGPDLQLLCRVMSTFESGDYIDAQCLRAGLRRDVAALLREVDVLALPTTGRTAPIVSDTDMRDGMADTTELNAACRFAFLGNLTGLPAGTAPVGRDARGMPIGLQIMGDAWDEAGVLRVLAHLERTGIASVPKPAVTVDLIG
jgi:Asp-tRNA(Asn)/Glu-tRNA(Gln) amidotransferase A subunit family amidase